MSRIGKAPIELPTGVTVQTDALAITVNGPKGTLTMDLPGGVNLKNEGSVIHVENTISGKNADAIHGFVRATLANMVKGVSVGWTRSLELSGVGYRAAVSGSTLTLTVGFSHPVVVEPPAGVTFAIVEGKIIVSGIDKQVVGQTAAKIRDVKKPEPYKGKGIKYTGEYIRKKAGKTAKAVGGSK
jgi:large subunit ribosomal protein L6